MFPPPWNFLPGFKAQDWPRHQGESSLPELADRLIKEFRIQPGDGIIGASLGGMVGCEIAARMDLSHLVLVGSAVDATEVRSVLRLLHPVAAIIPFRLLTSLARRIPSGLAKGFGASDPEFIRAMCRAVCGWPGSPPLAANPLRIHGRSDWIIRPPRKADLFLDGGHLISMTQAAACVDFLRPRLTQIER